MSNCHQIHTSCTIRKRFGFEASGQLLVAPRPRPTLGFDSMACIPVYLIWYPIGVPEYTITVNLTRSPKV